MKAISIDDINELAIYDSASEDKFVSYYDLKHLYDNAQDVGGEPVAYACYDTTDENNKCAFLADDKDLQLAKEHPFAIITPLYTTPQPDRVAELEAKLKEYEADARRYQWLKSSKKDHELTVCWWDKNGAVELLPERIDPAIDQAMKG